MDESQELSRLRWRCRRGMLELDVLLERYFDRHYAQSGPVHREAFGQLISLQDPELHALLIGGAHTDNPALRDVIKQILAYD